MSNRLVVLLAALCLVSAALSADLIRLETGEEVAGRLLFDKLELKAAHGTVLVPRSSLVKLVRVGGGVTASLENGMTLEGIPAEPRLQVEVEGEERDIPWEEVEWVQVGSAPDPPSVPDRKEGDVVRVPAGRRSFGREASSCPLKVEIPLTALAGLEVQRGRYLVGDRLARMECRRLSVMELIVESRREGDGTVVLTVHPRLWVRPPRDKRVDLTVELYSRGEMIVRAHEMAIEAEEDSATMVSVPLPLTSLEWEQAFSTEANTDLRLTFEVWDA